MSTRTKQKIALPGSMMCTFVTDIGNELSVVGFIKGDDIGSIEKPLPLEIYSKKSLDEQIKRAKTQHHDSLGSDKAHIDRIER